MNNNCSTASCSNTQTSPDPSPIKKTRMKSFVLVKEYKTQQSGNIEKNYVQKTILGSSASKLPAIKSCGSLESFDDISFDKMYNQIKTFQLPMDKSLFIDYDKKVSVTQILEEDDVSWWKKTLTNASKTLAVGLLVAGGTFGLYQITKRGDSLSP